MIIEDNLNNFFHMVPALLIISLNSRAKNVTGLGKETGSPFSYVTKILKTFESAGLVDFEKKGKIKMIKLTKKGQDIADNIESIRGLICDR